MIPRPTFIKTNEFTEVFQIIVDTYGTPTYKEANPAVISIATFPFFFGMMFGDMGHGSIITCFAIYLILFARSLKRNK
jgi:V-type H+-transporting ATPase subunit a